MAGLAAAAVGGAGAGALGLGTVTVDGIAVNLAEITGWTVAAALGIFMIVSLVKGWVIVKLHYDTLITNLTTRAEAAEAANERLSERAAILTETNNIQARTIEQNSAVGTTVTKLVNAIQDARTKEDAP